MHEMNPLEWPKAKSLQRMLTRRRGLSMAGIAERLGVEEHSARALISRLRAAGMPIIKERDAKGGWLFRIDRPKGGGR